jgi:hypothetical protein
LHDSPHQPCARTGPTPAHTGPANGHNLNTYCSQFPSAGGWDQRAQQTLTQAHRAGESFPEIVWGAKSRPLPRIISPRAKMQLCCFRSRLRRLPRVSPGFLRPRLLKVRTARVGHEPQCQHQWPFFSGLAGLSSGARRRQGPGRPRALIGPYAPGPTVSFLGGRHKRVVRTRMLTLH